ncbi:hypothetical protein EON82_21715, partial [bacterium]
TWTLAYNGQVSGYSYWATNTRLHFKLRAGNSYGFSAFTDPLLGTTPPAAPYGPQAYGQSGRAVVTWQPPSSGGTGNAGAFTYSVKRATVSGGPYAVVASGISDPLTYNDTGLTNGTVYYYVIAAVGAGGEGPSSTEVNAKPMAWPPGLSATVKSSTQIDLAWTPVAGMGFNAYELQSSTTGTGNWSRVGYSEIYGNSASHTGLTPRKRYYYRIAYINSGGTSEFSPVVNAVTNLEAPNPKAVGRDGRIELSWPAVNKATAYKIARSLSYAGTYTDIGTVTTTSYTDNAVTNGTTYHYKVRGSSPGPGDPSHPVSAMPQPPSLLSIKVTPSTVVGGQTATGTVRLSEAVRTAPVTVALNSDSTYAAVASSVTIPVGRDWVEFTVSTTQVAAFSTAKIAANMGIRSVSVLIGVSTAGLPRNVKVVPLSTSSLRVSWFGADGATGYRVERSTDGTNGWTVVGELAASPFEDSGLASSTTYWYRVSSQVGAMVSGPSDVANGTTLTATPLPQTPFPLEAVCIDGVVRLSWKRPAGAARFTVGRSTTAGGPYTNIQTNLVETEAKDASVVAGTTYHYVTIATSLTGETVQSVEGSVLATAPEGSVPAGRVVITANGTYGTTSQGGAHGTGVIFRFDPSGPASTLRPFDPKLPDGSNGSGASPTGRLLLGPGGYIYG